MIEAPRGGKRLKLGRQLGSSGTEAQETGALDRAAAATARSTALTSRTAAVSAARSSTRALAMLRPWVTVRDLSSGM
jgi:hypothetical protein